MKNKTIAALKIAAIAAVGAFLQAFGVPAEISVLLTGIFGQ